MDTSVIVAICTCITTVIGFGVAFVQNKRLKAAGEAAIPYVEGAACYEQGIADYSEGGSGLTDNELIKLGKHAAKHYEKMKEVFLK